MTYYCVKKRNNLLFKSIIYSCNLGRNKWSMALLWLLCFNAYPTTSCSMCLTSNPSYSAKHGLKAPEIQRRLTENHVKENPGMQRQHCYYMYTCNWLKAFPQWSSISPHLDKPRLELDLVHHWKGSHDFTAWTLQPWVVRFKTFFFSIFFPFSQK